ncbi:MAG: hypothetical protein AAFR17_15850 [Pseudomonadota bacterium]
MPDEGIIPNDGEGDRIILVAVKESYWLLEGEPHLNAMLSDMAPFPKPVRCVQFDSEFDLNLFLPDGQNLMGLWGINPAIVERLKKKNELVVIDPPVE